MTNLYAELQMYLYETNTFNIILYKFIYFKVNYFTLNTNDLIIILKIILLWKKGLKYPQWYA